MLDISISRAIQLKYPYIGENKSKVKDNLILMIFKECVKACLEKKKEV